MGAFIAFIFSQNQSLTEACADSIVKRSGTREGYWGKSGQALAVWLCEQYWACPDP